MSLHPTIYLQFQWNWNSSKDFSTPKTPTSLISPTWFLAFPSLLKKPRTSSLKFKTKPTWTKFQLFYSFPTKKKNHYFSEVSTVSLKARKKSLSQFSAVVNYVHKLAYYCDTASAHTLAGGTLPAAVIWPVKNRPKWFAANTTAL